MTEEEGKRFDQVIEEITKQMGCKDFAEVQEKREWDKVDPKLLEEFGKLLPVDGGG